MALIVSDNVRRFALDGASNDMNVIVCLKWRLLSQV
jgi:hypothetical protein